MSDMFKVGEVFPNANHRDRINRYIKNKKIFKGEHFEVFEGYNGSTSRKDLLYISSNIASIICKKSADFLFGEVLQVKASQGNNTNEQKAFDGFVENNNLNILTYENALSNAFRGDGFIKVRYGQEYGGVLTPDQDEPRVIIENISAENVFPETSDFDCNKILCFHIAIPVGNNVGEADETWTLFVESHYAGYIEYHSYQITPLETTSYGKYQQIISYRIESENSSDRTVVPTGVPIPLVVHVPNYALDDSWEGLNDLTEHMSIFEEINNRLTQIADILNSHANPAMAVPQGIIDEDDAGNPVFNVRVNKVFEIMGKEDIVPSYITWDGQLDSAFRELEVLLDLLLATAEIPAVAIGKGDSAGTSGTSGLSIKFRMSSLLAKINRKRQYYSKGLQQVFKIAQLLDMAVGNTDYTLSKPRLIFQDGLPQDDSQDATTANIRTGGMKTMSQKSAIMKLNDMTEEEADKEIEMILEETERDTPEPLASPDMFNEPVEGKPESDTAKHAKEKPEAKKEADKAKGKTGTKKAEPKAKPKPKTAPKTKE